MQVADQSPRLFQAAFKDMKMNILIDARSRVSGNGSSGKHNFDITGTWENDKDVRLTITLKKGYKRKAYLSFDKNSKRLEGSIDKWRGATQIALYESSRPLRAHLMEGRNLFRFCLMVFFMSLILVGLTVFCVMATTAQNEDLPAASEPWPNSSQYDLACVHSSRNIFEVFNNGLTACTVEPPVVLKNQLPTCPEQPIQATSSAAALVPILLVIFGLVFLLLVPIAYLHFRQKFAFYAKDLRAAASHPGRLSHRFDSILEGCETQNFFSSWISTLFLSCSAVDMLLDATEESSLNQEEGNRAVKAVSHVMMRIGGSQNLRIRMLHAGFQYMQANARATRAKQAIVLAMKRLEAQLSQDYVDEAKLVNADIKPQWFQQTIDYLEALENVLSQKKLTFFFVKAEVLVNWQDDAGSLPSFFDLWCSGSIETWQVDKQELVKGRFETKDRLIISHRWQKTDLEHPDPDSTQLKVIQAHLSGHKHIEYVWLDWACLPQSTKFRIERAVFGEGLKNINFLYATMPVLILLDISYLSRFWTQYEAWLSMRSLSENGLGTTAEEHLRCSIVCHGAAAVACESRLKQSLIMQWREKSADDAISILKDPFVEVTNQGDKKMKLEQLPDFVAEIVSIFNSGDIDTIIP